MTSNNVAKRGRVQYIQYRPPYRSSEHATPQVLATRCCPLHVHYLFTILKVGLKPAQGFAINTKAKDSLCRRILALFQCYGRSYRLIVSFLLNHYPLSSW